MYGVASGTTMLSSVPPSMPQHRQAKPPYKPPVLELIAEHSTQTLLPYIGMEPDLQEHLADAYITTVYGKLHNGVLPLQWQ